MTFQVDGNGGVTAFVRHAGAIDAPAPKISAGEAARIAGRFAGKEKNQTRDPNSEIELRRNIDGLREGNPPYDGMGPELTSQTKRGLSRLQTHMVSLGAIKSMSFKGVTPIGADIYDVICENGSVQWRIILGANGKVENLGFQILP